MKIPTEVTIAITNRVESPALFGYFRPRLLLPEGILGKLNYDDLRYVFLHELGHLKRHDIAVSWLMALLQVAHWFNPLVWYAFHKMQADRESACDAYILSQIDSNQSANYARIIIHLLEMLCQNRRLPMLAGILEGTSNAKRRIAMIMQHKKQSRSLSLLAISFLVSIGFVLVTSTQGLSTGDVLKLSEVDRPPMPISKVDPVYPPEAEKNRIQGTVTLSFVVTKEGKVRAPSVMLSEPKGVFDEAMLKAIAEWRFEPAIKNEKVVEVVIVAPFQFKLADTPAAKEATP